MYIIELIYDRLLTLYESSFLEKSRAKKQDLGNPARKEVFAKTSPKAGFSKTIFYIFP